MRAFHGTTPEKKDNIIRDGFRFDTVLQQGKLFGDAIYFTTRRERAMDFGIAIIEVEINTNNFMFICNKTEYDDFFKKFVHEALHPFKSIEEYILDKFITTNKNREDLTSYHLEKVVGPMIKEAEYRVGTAIRTHLVSRDYNGLALLMGDTDVDYYELTVYDGDTIKIL